MKILSVLPIILFPCGLILFFKMIFLPKSREKNGNNSFSSSMLALAGTLGVGNITGVAGAISLGGAGALFWMWLASLFAMPIKFFETYFAVKFPDKTGKAGATVYIRDILGSKFLAAVFALLCILGSFTVGNIIQFSACIDSALQIGINKFIIPIFSSVIIFTVLTKNMNFVKNLMTLVIPFLTLAFVTVSLIIIFRNADLMPSVFGKIFKSAFNFGSFSAGTVGNAIKYGTSRGIISNEAGCGTSPFAHCFDRRKNPFSEGLWGIFEVFTDTALLCSLTGFVILIAPESYLNLPVGQMLNYAFRFGLGDSTLFSDWFLTLSMLFYAVASAVCWSQYAIICLDFLNANKKTVSVYKTVFSLAVFIPAVFTPTICWTLADITVLFMTLINTVSVLIMAFGRKR